MKNGLNQLMGDAERSRAAALRWGSLVVLLLASQVAIGVAAIFLAGSDPSVSVVPGYHHKAMLWDESVALRNSSRTLGWNVELQVLPGLSTSTVLWTVRDRQATALENLRGTVMMFHHARADQPIEFRIEDHPDGIALERVGLWQVEMTLEGQDAEHSPVRFFDSQSIDLKRAK